MKSLAFLALLALITGTLLPGCATDANRTGEQETSSQEQRDADTDEATAPSNISDGKVYSNQRFREVRVERLGGDQFLITGQAQVFEATYAWVIEDGHHELEQGFGTTDAGAPEWGNFEFAVSAEKRRAESTLHLVLFEHSAKDGSRQHELAVPLH